LYSVTTELCCTTGTSVLLGHEHMTFDIRQFYIRYIVYSLYKTKLNFLLNKTKLLLSIKGYVSVYVYQFNNY